MTKDRNPSSFTILLHEIRIEGKRYMSVYAWLRIDPGSAVFSAVTGEVH